MGKSRKGWSMTSADAMIPCAFHRHILLSTSTWAAVMRKLFGRDKPKRAIEEDTPLPPPQPYPFSGSRSSSFSSLPLPAKSTKSDRDGDSRWSRKKQPAVVGILKALDPHIEAPHPGVSSDDSPGQYESSIRDDKKDWKIFGERKERDGERGRHRDRGGREEDGQTELTRMIGTTIPLVPLSPAVLTTWKAI